MLNCARPVATLITKGRERRGSLRNSLFPECGQIEEPGAGPRADQTEAALALRGLFPSTVAVATRPIEALEIADLQTTRRNHRRLGRLCASEALSRLDASADGLSQVWPEGFTGSISHCDTLCCAVAAKTSHFAALGVDVEVARDIVEGIELVCGDAELAHFHALPPLPAGNWPLLAFSAKEAFYKCQHPLTGRLLDFRDFEIRFEVLAPAAGRFALRRTRSLPIPETLDLDIEGAWAADRSHAYTAAWIRQPAR